MYRSMARFREGRIGVDNFIDEFLVVCPRCRGCARVARIDASNHWLFAPRKMTCASCGYVRHWEGTSLTRYGGEPPLDDYFGLPLWIQAPCCGHVLWAYNWRHLEYIESFVGALHRERRRDSYGWANRTMASRFPRWMKAAQNRVPLLECIDKLRHRGSA